MKNILYRSLLLFATVMAAALVSCGDDEGDDPKPDKEESQKGATDITPWFGVNMSGAEFAAVYPGVEGTHYGFPTRDDIAYFRNKGMRLIRFPFRWERVQREMGGELDATYLKKMKEVVEIARSLDVEVLLDMHNFGRYCIYSNGSNSDDNTYAIIGQKACSIEDFCDVWIKLAREFKDYDNIWGYDIMNEPYEMLRSTPWLTIAQPCIDAIRTVDKTTPIVICGNEYASATRWVNLSDELKELTDPSNLLVYEAHVYFDKDLSGNYNNDFDTDGANFDIGAQRLRPFVEWCQKNGKRGFVGEYGIPDSDGRWCDVLDRALSYLSDNGIGGTYWSAGPRWGDYPLSVQPTNNYTTDRPQMATLAKYLKAK